MTLFGLFVPQQETPLHSEALHAFATGLEKANLPHTIFPLEDGYRPCEIAVTFGVYKKRTPRGRIVGEIIATHNCLAPQGRHVVIERGFIHRDRYFMVGWGGLNGRADFCNAGSPPDRWEQLNVQILPWRKKGKHIVLCGQVPWDASVQHTDHITWCRETAKTLARFSRRRVIFRPHPLQPTAIDISDTRARLSSSESLQQDLINAWAVVTFNSNAGVEATLAGIPAFVADEGAMGYSILNRDLKQIESPRMPDRSQWLYDLAYTQWTLAEIASGQTIQHLWKRELVRSRDCA